MAKPVLPDCFSKVNSPFNKNETEFMYKLTLYVERLLSSKKTKGFDIHKINTWKKENGVILTHNKKHVGKPQNDNEIIYKKNASSCGFSLLRHLRNAFAHGIFERKGDKFIFKDMYRGSINMYGIMKRSLFFELINEIIKTRTINNKNNENKQN